MIKVESLSKSFPKKTNKGFGKKKEKVCAIQDVSFEAQDGVITGLLGANGAGKSTTMRIIASLTKADTGSAVVDGYDVAKQPLAVREKIGFLPHNSGIYPRLTAIENIAYYAEICGLENTAIKTRIDELIPQLDMSSFADRRTEGFSQGQRTKVALARALVHKPKTLILDEPTNGLDVMATRNLRSIIRNLRDEGHCILFSSHVMQEVAALCDHVVIIDQGIIAMADSIEGIKARTGQDDLEDAFVAAIGGDLNEIEFSASVDQGVSEERPR